jgi:uncharacterized protein YdhG (YjbR/CyaY superfamily)
MEGKMLEPGSIDAYISDFPIEIQEILTRLRIVIKEAAPAAEEAIKYRMPTFMFYGNLVHFAAYEHHIGFYPTPSGIKAFENELSDYKTSKGAIQFPIEKPLPFDLISKIVRFRVAENMQQAQNPAKRKKY